MHPNILPIRESTHLKVYQQMKILMSSMGSIVTALQTQNMDAATILASIWKTTITPYHDHRILVRATIARIDPMAIVPNMIWPITTHGHICPHYTNGMVVRVARRVPCHRTVLESQLANSSDVAPCLSKSHCKHTVFHQVTNIQYCVVGFAVTNF